MNVIRFNWIFIRKLAGIFVFIYLIQLVITYIYLFDKKPTLKYDYKSNRFLLLNRNYTLLDSLFGSYNVEYEHVKLSCVNFYYYKILPYYWSYILDTIIELNEQKQQINCIHLIIPWNLYELNLKHSPKLFYSFNKNKFYNLNTLINLIKSYKFYVIIKVDAYHRSDSYLDFGGLPYWLLNANSESVKDSSEDESIDENSKLNNEERFSEFFNEKYTSYLNKLVYFLNNENYFYKSIENDSNEGGPVIGILIDYDNLNLYKNIIKDVFYTNSIYDHLLVNYNIDLIYKTISLILPHDLNERRNYVNYTIIANELIVLKKLNVISNYFGDKLYEAEDSIMNHSDDELNEKLKDLLLNKNYSFILNNYHCLYNNDILNGANLVSKHSSLVYKPFSTEINMYSCYVSNKHKKTNAFYKLKTKLSKINDKIPISFQFQSTKQFYNVSLTHYLNLNNLLTALSNSLRNELVINKKNFDLNFEQFAVHEFYLNSDSATQSVQSFDSSKNNDVMFMVYKARNLTLTKGTVIKIQKYLFADYMILMCNSKQLLHLSRMDFDQHKYYMQNSQSNKEEFYEKLHHRGDTVQFKLNKNCDNLTILVENMGRLNDNTLSIKMILNEKKGLFNKFSIVYNQTDLIHDWSVYAINLEKLMLNSFIGYNSILKSISSKNSSIEYPALLYTRIDLRQMFGLVLPRDNSTFYYLSMVNWIKGVVIFNGNYLGRYWSVIGQLCTLYIPHAIINYDGINEIFVFEMHNFKNETTKLTIQLTNFNQYAPCLRD